MKFKIFGFILTGIVVLNFSGACAQSYAETALLFSRTRPGGSARIQALGGSQIALGGDFSSAASNPAGLGMYNRSEFTFTPALNFQTISSDYLGTTASADRSWLTVPGLSLVWHLPKNDDSFFGGSFAITMSRTNDFNREIIYRGNNENNSIVDWFISEANGDNTDQFDEDGGWEYNTLTGLAYYNYLIGPWSSHPDGGPDDEYFTYAGYPVQQEETVVKGGTNQWSISYGGNLGDRFFFGGGLGISSLKYKSQKLFSEQYDNPEVIRSMHFTENLDIRGTGVNLTLGAIARPIDFLQVGLSYSTPTFYNLTETFDASMITDWNNFSYWLPNDPPVVLNDNSNDPVSTDIVTSEYNLRTPAKLSGGVAFISKIGFITADVELVNYQGAKYSSDGDSYSFENDEVDRLYKNSVNIRTGAEFRYQKFRVRAGFSHQGKTYRKGFDVNNSISSISGGVGYRHENFFIDLAVINSTQPKYLYQPYTFPDGSGPTAEFKPRLTTGMITLGFTF
jgi:hypothetical protein